MCESIDRIEQRIFNTILFKFECNTLERLIYIFDIHIHVNILFEIKAQKRNYNNKKYWKWNSKNWWMNWNLSSEKWKIELCLVERTATIDSRLVAILFFFFNKNNSFTLNKRETRACSIFLTQYQSNKTRFIPIDTFIHLQLHVLPIIISSKVLIINGKKRRSFHLAIPRWKWNTFLLKTFDSHNK